MEVLSIVIMEFKGFGGAQILSYTKEENLEVLFN
jgi:hypothetical protein